MGPAKNRSLLLCQIDPRALTNLVDAPLDRLLRYYQDQECKGLGEVMPNMPVMHPMVQNLFKHAQDVGFPVILDSSDRLSGDFGLYDDTGLPQLEHTLQRFPKLTMLGHGPVFWSEIGRLETPAQRKTLFNPDGHQVGTKPPRGSSSRIAIWNVYGGISCSTR